MANAARPAHPVGLAPRASSRALAAGLCLGLTLSAGPGRAEPAPDPATETATKTADGSEGPTSSTAAAPQDADATDGAKGAEPAPGDADHPAPDQSDETEGEKPATEDPPTEDAPVQDTPTEDAPTEDDPTEDDPTEDDPPAPAAPGPAVEPLRPMQTAAWWTMFGAFAVGTTAGVFAGLAERQEDRAARLSTLYDTSTGAQPLYADRKDEYEQYLRRGQGFATAAIGVGVASGVAAVAAITLFAIDARRQRDARPRGRASLRPRLGGVEVRF